MKKITLLMLIVYSFIFVKGQGDAESQSKVAPAVTEYNRNALTVLILNNHNRYMNDLEQASSGILIPDKFDNNLLSKRTITSRQSNEEAIQLALINEKIPNDILARWFARDDSGRFSMEVIHKRGLYNATDDEVRKASGSKLGMAKLKDAGEILIDHSYIMVLEFSNIKTMDQIYDAQDAAKRAIMGDKYEPVKRRKNGWKGNVKAYIYRLNFNDSIVDIFYNDLWIYDDDDEAVIAEKKAKFEQMNFPLASVITLKGKADGSQYNAGEILAPPRQLTKEELFQKMINTGMSSILYDVERKVEEFRVKTPLYGTHPLRAKIGKKEGVKTDYRYFVIELEQNKKGETKAVRKGVVRAKKAVDNRQKATGNSKLYTTFYQTAGHSLMSGMLLQQRNDLGFGVSTGISTGEIGGAFVKGEANLSVLAGRYAGMDLGITQLKFYAVGGWQDKEYIIHINNNNTKYDVSFARWQIGISKGWYFAHHFSLAFLLGYGQETALCGDYMENENYDSDDYFATEFVNFGAYMTLNVTYWLQLMGTANLYGPIGYATDKDDNSWKNVDNNELYYTDIFKNRSGLSFDLGLRVEF